MNQSTNKQPTKPVVIKAPKKPNETGSISVEGHIRIFDPQTQTTFVEKRA